MTRLTEALTTLGLTGEVTHAGRWVRLPGERGAVYVIEAGWDSGFFTWCDVPGADVVEFYRDPTEAIRAGFARVGRGKAETPRKGGGTPQAGLR